VIEQGVELTNYTRSTKEVAKQVGGLEVYVDRRAHVEELTRVEGMCNWRTRVERGRAGSEEQAENWEDAGKTHEAVKTGP
jgi:hypothetical protein